MTALVTGATGFIGSYILKKLLQRKEKVRVLIEKNEEAELGNIDVEKIYGNILDIDLVRAALSGCDVLFHSDFLASFKKADYSKMEDINVKGTVNVFTAALEAGVRRAVYTSSVSAIGVHPSVGIADEETSFNLEHLGVGYIDTRHRAEKEAMKLYQKGLPLVVLNVTGVIGPRNMLGSRFILAYCKKRIPGYIDGGMNIVDVDDVAEGHILAAAKGRIGERYILGNRNLSLKEFVYLLEKVTGIVGRNIKIPYSIALAAGFVMENTIGLVNPNYVGMTVDSVKSGALYWYFDSSKARRELGYTTKPIEETLIKTVKWFQDNGYL